MFLAPRKKRYFHKIKLQPSFSSQKQTPRPKARAHSAQSKIGISSLHPYLKHSILQQKRIKSAWDRIKLFQGSQEGEHSPSEGMDHLIRERGNLISGKNTLEGLIE